MIFWAVEAALGVDVTEGMHAFLDSAELLARRSGSRLAAAFASFIAANWSLAMGSTESPRSAAWKRSSISRSSAPRESAMSRRRR